MTPTKELFLKRSDIRDHLLAICKSDWFAECMVYAEVLALEHGTPTPDFVRGVQVTLATLMTMADQEPALPANLSSGLIHDFEKAKAAKNPETKS